MAQRSASPGKRRPPPALKRILQPDWAWIEREWCADLKSTREIARASTAAGRKISHVAIEKRAEKHGWVKKDLPAKVRQKIEQKLAEKAARSINTVTGENVTDEQIVEAAAEQGVSIVTTHRADIAKLRQKLAGLTDELVADPAATGDLVDAVVELTTPAKDAKPEVIDAMAQRRAKILRAIGLGTRVSIAKDLTQALRPLVALERQAFNVDARHQGTTLEDYLKALDD